MIQLVDLAEQIDSAYDVADVEKVKAWALLAICERIEALTAAIEKAR